MDEVYIKNCLELSIPISESIHVDKDLKSFMDVSREDLDDRMDVDLWIKLFNTSDSVDLKECPYNMERLLGK